MSAEVAGWIQDLALSMLAAEVAAEQRRALQQRLRHQIKEASGQLQEGAAEAGEAQTAVGSKLVAKAAQARIQMHRQAIHG